jgi:hypothetical protein
LGKINAAMPMLGTAQRAAGATAGAMTIIYVTCWGFVEASGQHGTLKTLMPLHDVHFLIRMMCFMCCPQTGRSWL